MNEKPALQAKLLANPNPSRDQIVAYLKVVLEECRKLPLDKLSQETKYTAAQELAYDIYPLVQFDVADADSAIHEICSLAGSLEVNPNDPDGWENLMNMIEQLG